MPMAGDSGKKSLFTDKNAEEHMAEVRITSIVFSHFKAFERFTLSLEHTNVLTGANNAGKSTIIGALRALSIAHRSARSRKPERISWGAERPLAYRISERTLPISLENTQTNYQDGESKVTFRLSNGARLHLCFDTKEGCVLVPEVSDRVITSAASFKSHFPMELTVVPVLGPVEHRERLVEAETVNGALATARASRHFRNYWFRRPDEFAAFAELVERTWPGMRIGLPELDTASTELSMFVSEDRVDRELFWVGSGFQIWCQLLTHLHRAAGSSLVVIDEPEIYLHPELQRRLIGVLSDLGPDVILATHSTEIVAEVDPADLVLIDKRRRGGERLKDIEGVQRAIDILGSQQNITLAALARHRRVLFVEGDADFAILRRFARRLGLDELSAGMGLAAMPSGGFGSWRRISVVADGVKEALGTDLLIGAVYDRDFYCDEEIQDVLGTLGKSLRLAHVHQRKELENYLLVPAALDRAIDRALADRERTEVARRADQRPPSHELLEEITDQMRDEVEAQCVSKYSHYVKSHRKSGVDDSTLTRQGLKRFRQGWSDLSRRLALVSGKETLRRLRQRLADSYGISLSDARIIDAMRQDEMPTDLKEFLLRLDQFRREVVSEPRSTTIH